jgi:hypothetical protein
MTWSSIAEKIELVVEQKLFVQGGFREVYTVRQDVQLKAIVGALGC